MYAIIYADAVIANGDKMPVCRRISSFLGFFGVGRIFYRIYDNEAIWGEYCAVCTIKKRLT